MDRVPAAPVRSTNDRVEGGRTYRDRCRLGDLRPDGRAAAGGRGARPDGLRRALLLRRAPALGQERHAADSRRPRGLCRGGRRRSRRDRPEGRRPRGADVRDRLRPLPLVCVRPGQPVRERRPGQHRRDVRWHLPLPWRTRRWRRVTVPCRRARRVLRPRHLLPVRRRLRERLRQGGPVGAVAGRRPG
jgi:hypothetical protein